MRPERSEAEPWPMLVERRRDARETDGEGENGAADSASALPERTEEEPESPEVAHIYLESYSMSLVHDRTKSFLVF